MSGSFCHLVPGQALNWTLNQVLNKLQAKWLERRPYLSAYGVGDGGDELPAEAELAAYLARKVLRGVLLLGEVPLELVDERDVAHVDVQLDDDALVGLQGRDSMYLPILGMS